VHDEGAAGDLGAHLRSLADHQGVSGDDGAGEATVDPDGALEGELPVLLGAAPEEGVEIAADGGDRGIFTLEHGHGRKGYTGARRCSTILVP
jgi:hypothetical protein